MHSTHLGAVGHTRVRPHTLSSTPIRHQNGLVVYSLSKRTCKKATRRGQLHLLAASSTDVEPQNEVTRSAQDLAQGIQDFLEESQKALSIEEAPLPEHPVGEEGTIKVADCIDASVRPEVAAVANPNNGTPDLLHLSLLGSGSSSLMRVCYAQVIRVPSDFLAREGLKLTPEYTIGKEIGGGVQGRVLALNTADGDKTDKLLKVHICSRSLVPLLSRGTQFTLVTQHTKHHTSAQASKGSVYSLEVDIASTVGAYVQVMKYKLATAVTGLDVGLKREWLIGQQLNTITGQDGQLHGMLGPAPGNLHHAFPYWLISSI